MDTADRGPAAWQATAPAIPPPGPGADCAPMPGLQGDRHGWLRLTPAHPARVVEGILAARRRPARVLDPFCGTGTTALCAATLGHDAVTVDINPFLVWLARAKTAHYAPGDIAAARDAHLRALRLARSGTAPPAPAPPIRHVERWWAPDRLEFLRRLRSAIDAAAGCGSPARDLLLVAFCRTAIALADAAFHHTSLSFRPRPLLLDMGEMFSQDVDFVLRGAADNPRGRCEVVLGDSRNPAATTRGTFDLVITSPPHANRMSYVRELRPHMCWLGFLRDPRDAGELGWASIGGAWGAATSRLARWTPSADRPRIDSVESAVEAIRRRAAGGPILANYVARYFDDTWTHLKNLRAVLAPGAEAHYIVGNSSFYGIPGPTEEAIAALLRALGFSSVRATPIRKRNSKRELAEFDVSARWEP